jgi:hypothetical protein
MLKEKENNQKQFPMAELSKGERFRQLFNK